MDAGIDVEAYRQTNRKYTHVKTRHTHTHTHTHTYAHMRKYVHERARIACGKPPPAHVWIRLCLEQHADDVLVPEDARGTERCVRNRRGVG